MEALRTPDERFTNLPCYLHRWEKPFLTAFSDSDPITAGGDRVLQSDIPGAKGRAHTTIEGAGHFLQEDRAEQLARVVVDFVETTPGSGERPVGRGTRPTAKT